MAYSYALYAGSGVDRNFTFSFPYLDKSHISVKVAGVAVAFSWLSANTVQTAVAPGVGTVVEISRNTPKDVPLVDFSDGSILLEKDLDLLALFNLYCSQEAIDTSSRGIILNSAAVYDAKGNRIVNVGPPVNDGDAVNKGWVRGFLDWAIAACTGAATSTSADAATATAAKNTAVSAASSASASLASFQSKYLGAYSVAPTIDPNGNPLAVGASYWSTVFNKMFIWSGTSWLASDVYQQSSLVTFEYVTTAGQTVISGNDVSGKPLSYGYNSLSVYHNGLLLRPAVDYTATTGNSITLLAPVTVVAGDEIVAVALQAVSFGTTSSSLVSFAQVGTGAVARSTQDKARELRKSVEDYGGTADGVTNNDSAIAKAVAASGGQFHFPGPGVYVCSSSVWNYAFTAGDNVSLKTDGTTYNVSNAIAGAWRLTVDSPVLMSLRHAVSGKILQQWQDGNGGTATYFYRGLAFKTDSHFLQCKPATAGGSTDLLFQRSDTNVDPNGNRFNITFEEAVDRLLFSFATSTSGAPSFDTFLGVTGGPSPTLSFPAIAALFNMGMGTQARSGATFGLKFEPKTAAVVAIKDSVSGTEIGTVDSSRGFTLAQGLRWSNPAYGSGSLDYISNGVAVVVEGTGNLSFFQNGSEAWRINTSRNFVPGLDNTYSIGEASRRPSTIFAGSAVINTSDERAKEAIGEIPQEWLDAWAEVEFCRFKYRDAVTKKGTDARWHVGLVAQRVKEVFERHGIDPFSIGILCWDEWDDQYAEELQSGKEAGERKLLKKAGNLYGIRYEEALALECAYLRSKLKAQ